jgi:hypothetical protein
MHRKFLHTANHPSIILVWLFIALLFLVVTSLSAQKPLPRPSNNVIYGEAYGVGGFYSVNYERVLFRAWKEKLMVSASIGGSNFYTPRDIQYYYFLERLNVAYGYKGWFLEIGSNLVLARGRSYSYRGYWMGWNKHGVFFPHFGLRYQKNTLGPFFKAYFFPIHNVCCYNDFYLYLIDKPWHGPEWYWWGGIAAGFAF